MFAKNSPNLRHWLIAVLATSCGYFYDEYGGIGLRIECETFQRN